MQILDWLSKYDAQAWAAWVQAIGSVVAIFFAVQVGRHQARVSAEAAKAAIEHSQKIIEDQEITRMVELFAAPIAIAQEFLAAAACCHEKMEYSRATNDRQDHHGIVERMRDVVRALEKLEPHRLPSVPAFERWWIFQESAKTRST